MKRGLISILIFLLIVMTVSAEPFDCQSDATCLEEKFTTCESAKQISTLEFPAGFFGPDPATVDYEYEILGYDDNNLCQIKNQYLTNPNSDWLNKEMICGYDNSLSLNDAIIEVGNSLSTDNPLGNCSGELFNLLVGAQEEFVPEEQWQGKQLIVNYFENALLDQPGFVLKLDKGNIFLDGIEIEEIVILPGTGIYFKTLNAEEYNKLSEPVEGSRLVTSLKIDGRNYLISLVPEFSELFTDEATIDSGKAYKLFTKKDKIKPMWLNGEISTNEIFFSETNNIFYSDNERKLKKLAFDSEITIKLLAPEEIIAETCVDSDKGVDPGQFGIVKGKYTSQKEFVDKWEDYCASSNELVEYSCMEGKIRFNTFVCPMGCSEGVCIDLPYCLDSDGTLQAIASTIRYDYYVGGNTKLWDFEGADPIVSKDACQGSQLIEYQCNNDLEETVSPTVLDCPQGFTCSNGACVETSEDEDLIDQLQERLDRLNTIKKRVEALEKGEVYNTSKETVGFFSNFGKIFSLFGGSTTPQEPVTVQPLTFVGSVVTS